jgi:uncharacterized lipoprotein (TIGR02269 family)
MVSPLRSSVLVLTVLLLGGCGTPSSGVREDVGRCEHADAEECVVLACDGGECGLFGCEDVDPEALAPEVELARGYRPPQRPPAFRNWRSLGLRPGARPRMVFHFRYRQGFLPALPREPGRLVHHHLFPQQHSLAQWFTQNGVDIHKFTILIPEHIHRQVHSGSGRGGMWNRAWLEFMRVKKSGPVTPEELHRKAVELIFRFELTGPVVPYNTRVAPYEMHPQLRGP